MKCPRHLFFSNARETITFFSKCVPTYGYEQIFILWMGQAVPWTETLLRAWRRLERVWRKIANTDVAFCSCKRCWARSFGRGRGRREIDIITHPSWIKPIQTKSSFFGVLHTCIFKTAAKEKKQIYKDVCDLVGIKGKLDVLFSVRCNTE